MARGKQFERRKCCKHSCEGVEQRESDTFKRKGKYCVERWYTPSLEKQ